MAISRDARHDLPGTLVVLTGIDGSGKSTALEALKRLQFICEFGSYEPQTWLDPQRFPDLAWTLDPDLRDRVGGMPSRERAMFLAAMVSAHWESWMQPRLRLGTTVVMDSFYFRFWARERARGGEYLILERAISSLPSADIAFILDASPTTAASRKRAFDASETGGAVMPYKERAAFLEFQSRALTELRIACRRWARYTRIVDANPPGEVVVGSLVGEMAAVGIYPLMVNGHE